VDNNVQPLSSCYIEMKVDYRPRDEHGAHDVVVNHEMRVILIWKRIPACRREAAISDARQRAAAAQYQNRPGVPVV
jgi:hypothetical protein